MKAKLFKITCVTNLHVGSGELNFNIVDKEVEKDPNNDLHIINGSGIKGALLADKSIYAPLDKAYIFGKGAEENASDNGGKYKFLDARLLFRPVRVGGEVSQPYALTTTADAVNDMIDTAGKFGITVNGKTLEKVSNVDFGKDYKFAAKAALNIEGEKALKLNDDIAQGYINIIGDNFAVANDLGKIPLPIIARNNLGKNRNLWYEEYVPHKSVFWTIILFDGEEFKLNLNNVVQLGGNASIGNGYVKFEEIGANYEQTKSE